jgi:hypothetical protein
MCVTMDPLPRYVAEPDPSAYSYSDLHVPLPGVGLLVILNAVPKAI